MIRALAIRSGAVARAGRQPLGRRKLVWRLALGLVTLATAGVAAIPAQSSSGASALERETLAQALVIRAEVTARYRLLPSRKLVVTETTSTGVVRSLTLMTDWLEPWRVVPADNGIYFAICSARAKCPYPPRSAAWPVEAFLPRRLALELALRTLLQTSVNLVVVALPTARPAWVVVYRRLGRERENELIREAERLHRGARLRRARRDERTWVPALRMALVATRESVRRRLAGSVPRSEHPVATDEVPDS